MPFLHQSNPNGSTPPGAVQARELCFIHPAELAEPLAVGDAVRWVGPGVWRVEEIDGDRPIARLWPEGEPYPERIKECGPGEWPEAQEA